MASFMVYLTSYWTSCRVQNVAARIVVRASRYDHITSILETLHWLPVRYRIGYKVLLMTFKALHLLAPSYIAYLLQFFQLCRTLRSSSDSLLTVRSAHLRLYGDRAFCITAPRCRQTTTWLQKHLKLQILTIITENIFQTQGTPYYKDRQIT